MATDRHGQEEGGRRSGTKEPGSQPGQPSQGHERKRDADEHDAAHETRGTANTQHDGGRVTERGRERAREEDAFEPVIIKRDDTARRHADDVLEHTILVGLEQLERAPRSLALSSVAAGLMLTFSVMAMGVVAVATAGLDPSVRRVAMALVYPLGFIVCIMSSMELFTEHTATAVYPVLDRRAKWPRLVRLWLVVLAGNLVGSAAGSGMLAAAEGVVGARAGYLEVASHVASYDATTTFASAILAGSLMALGAWLIHATPPASTQVMVVYVVVFLIGLGGLHHSIAGSAELFVGLLVGSGQSVATVAKTIGIAAGGNLLGGSVFVAILNYGHVRSSQTVENRSSGKDEGRNRG